MQTAVNDKVIVQKIEAGKTAGGIDLPKDTTYDAARFLVVSVGPGHLTADGSRVPLCVEVGDLIIVAGKANGYKYKGKEYFVMSEAMIGVIIKKKDIEKVPTPTIHLVSEGKQK